MNGNHYLADLDHTAIFPVELDVLKVGLGDTVPDHPRMELAGPFMDFSLLTPREYRSERISQLPNYTADADTIGVHLHWTLPVAYASGETVSPTGKKKVSARNRELHFPAAPNRWLVLRIPHTESDTAKQEAWVVESDFCSTSPKWKGVTVPIEPTAKHAHAYAGRAVPLREWIEGRHDTTQSMLGWKMTAIGWGDPGFSAFYPSCRSVFGFHDRFAGEGEDRFSGSYAVIGWHSSPSDELLGNAELLWALADDPKGETLHTMKRTLFYGVTPRVEWGRNTHNGQTEPFSARVGLGNSVSESLATMQAAVFSENVRASKEAERGLNVLMADLNHSMPQVDNHAAHIDAELHVLRFISMEAGCNWAVRAKARSGQTKKAEEEYRPLPENLAVLAGSYSRAQQEYDYALRLWWVHRRNLSDHLSQLELMVWEAKSSGVKIEEFSAVRIQIREQMHRELMELYRIDLDALEKELQRTKIAMNEELRFEKAYELFEIPAPRFWVPRDPAVVLKCRELRSPERFWGPWTDDARATVPLIFDDGRFKDIPKGYLRGHVAAQLPTTAMPWKQLLKDSDNLAQSDIAQPLKPLIAWLLQIRLREQPDQRSYWPIVYARWEANYAPSVALRRGEETTYQADSLTSAWAFTKGAFDLAEMQPKAAIASKPSILRGVALVQKSLAISLADRLFRRLDQDDIRGDLKGMRDSEVTPMVSFLLEGFHAQLLTRGPRISLPHAQRQQLLHLQDVPEWAMEQQDGDDMRPDPDAPLYSPLRSGAFNLHRIELLDVFGRRREVLINTERDSITCFSASLTPVKPIQLNGRAAACLPPRLSLPARLAFRLRNATTDRDAQQYNSAETPVCGWIVPNHIEQDVAFCDQRGETIAIIRSSGSSILYNELIIAPDRTFEELHPNLRGLAEALQLNRLSLEGFLKGISSEVGAMVPEQTNRDSGMGLVLGRPLAVISAELGLDVLGGELPGALWLGEKTDARRGFDKVHFPVVLGDPARKNDGLAAFFYAEPGAPFDFTCAWTPTGRISGNSFSSSPSASCIPLTLGGYGRNQRMRLLLLADPQAPIHAVSGVLPVKEISLPPAHYRKASRGLSLLLPCGPLLLPSTEGWTLPLAPIEKQQWLWRGSGTAPDAGRWQPLQGSAPLTAQSQLTGVAEVRGRIWLALRPMEETNADTMTKERKPSA